MDEVLVLCGPYPGGGGPDRRLQGMHAPLTTLGALAQVLAVVINMADVWRHRSRCSPVGDE
jgi:hypothetical protein